MIKPANEPLNLSQELLPQQLHSLHVYCRAHSPFNNYIVLKEGQQIRDFAIRDSTKFLPPATEVWGKVMFSESVCQSIPRGGGLCMISRPVLLSGPMFLGGGGGRFCPGKKSEFSWNQKSGQYASYWNAFLVLSGFEG